MSPVYICKRDLFQRICSFAPIAMLLALSLLPIRAAAQPADDPRSLPDCTS